MKKNQSFLSENFQFSEVKFSIYLNRRVLIMQEGQLSVRICTCTGCLLGELRMPRKSVVR